MIGETTVIGTPLVSSTDVGTTEDYLFTLEPRHHCLTNPEAPSLVVVHVINGNPPIPSS